MCDLEILRFLTSNLCKAWELYLSIVFVIMRMLMGVLYFNSNDFPFLRDC